MAEFKGKNGHWMTTESGAHIFIESGESFDEAVEKAFGKENVGKYKKLEKLEKLNGDIVYQTEDKETGDVLTFKSKEEANKWFEENDELEDYEAFDDDNDFENWEAEPNNGKNTNHPYFKDFKEETVDVNKLVEDNDLNNPDALNYHEDKWNTKDVNSWKYDNTKDNDKNDVIYAIRQKDGKLRLANGRHRMKALSNSEYKKVKILVKDDDDVDKSKGE